MKCKTRITTSFSTSILASILLLIFSANVWAKKNPYFAQNNSWIRLSGTVATAGEQTFELDFGEGTVTVEMDGWKWYKSARHLLPGDRVTVYGKVDDDLYETTSIEASSVFVKGLNTYFFASAADEEDPNWGNTNYLNDGLIVTGMVTKVDGREFFINTGTQKIKVDTREMLYNPMDEKGFQRISKGDVIQVSGELDIGLFERNEIMAENIITLISEPKS